MWGRHVFDTLSCLLYTSDAADDMQCVDLGGRRIIKKNYADGGTAMQRRAHCAHDTMSSTAEAFFKQKTAYEM